MLNRNPSACTAAQQSTKSSLLFRQAQFLAILMLADVSCQNENKVEKEVTVEFTQSQLMVIYKNGYLNGKINASMNYSAVKSEEVWQIDSSNLSNRFFK